MEGNENKANAGESLGSFLSKRKKTKKKKTLGLVFVKELRGR